jgi:hypothetical protein
MKDRTTDGRITATASGIATCQGADVDDDDEA